MKKNVNQGSFSKRRLYKILLAMKLAFILTVVCSLQLSASVYSQNTRLSLSVNKSSLMDVFKEIRNNSEFSFVYDLEDVEYVQNVSLNTEDASVEEILKACFENTNLTYEIVDKVVVIKQKPYVAPVQEKAQAQEKKELKGTVTDEDGNTLPGVSVVVKGTTIGAATDIDGSFTLMIPEGAKTLFVSFIGMKSQEIDLNGKSVINLTLISAMDRLQEVVVTGMQKREKQHSIGAVSSISSEDMENVSVTTIDKGLGGKMAGVYVQSTSGRPGAVGNIRIRGINTMSGNKEPLYILDGMPLESGEVSGGVNILLTNGIGNIPPEDIASITILKDATASAIYGARAANGVIVIETKSGTSGKNYFSYTGKYGVTMQPKSKWDFMNSKEKLSYENQIYDEFHPSYGGRGVMLNNQLDNGVIDQATFDQSIADLGTVNTNWLDALYRNAKTQSHNLTMSGGTEKLQYYISANYQDSEGTLMGNEYKSGGINAKISRYINENLLVKLNLYTTMKQNKEGQSIANPFEYAIFANPYEKPYNEDGSYATDESYLLQNVSLTQSLGNFYTGFNILKDLKENTIENTYGNMRGQLSVEYKFLDGFRYIGTGMVNYTTVHDLNEQMPGSYTSWKTNWLNGVAGGQVLPEFNRGSIKESFGRTLNWSARNSLEYNKKFNKHLVSLFTASEVSASSNYQFGNFMPSYEADYRVAGYPVWNDINSQRYRYLDLSRLGSTSLTESRAASFIGSAMYSYDDRYVFNGTMRYDGVDIIGTDNQFTPLWSAGLKWNVHNESFLESVSDVISCLSLSLGYGFTGSINRSVYPFDTYVAGANLYDGIPYASSFSWGNTGLKWEKKEDINIGLEAAFLDGRISLNGQYYESTSKDVLDQRRLPASIGRTSATVNGGSLSNKGWELSARVDIIKNADLLWEVGGNISHVKNSLTDVYEKKAPGLPMYRAIDIEGYPANSWFGYKFSHVNPDNGHALVWAKKEINSTTSGQLVTTYEDELLDLADVSYADLTSNYKPYHLGKQDADWYGGFHTRINYKGFEMAANFTYAFGNKIISFQDRREGPNNPDSSDVDASRTNRTTDNLYRWRQAGDITNIPAYSPNVSNFNRFLMDTDLQDGSYLKCSQLSLGWRAKPKLLKNSPLESLKVSLVGSNLFTITKYEGADPETRTPFGYPNTPNYTLSLSVGF